MIEHARGLGWKLDNTSDLARVLRIPYTLNHKVEPKLVMIAELDQARRYDPLEFEPFVLGGIETYTAGSEEEDRNSSSEVYPKAELRPILDKCSFLQHCKADVETLSEPEWTAMLSISALCNDGKQKSHDLSASHPSYSYSETEQKVERAVSSNKPSPAKLSMTALAK